MKNKVVIVGPLPPAIGGIASIMKNLKSELSTAIFIDSSKSQIKFFNIFLPIILLLKIFLITSLNRRCKILFFSSAYNSFWEKCIWAYMASMLSAKPYIVMVDGNFPSFYQSLNERLKPFSKALTKNVIIVAQSLSWKKYYENIFPESQVDVISGGVDTDFFKPKTIPKNTKLNILYVGWLIKEKGVFDIIKACEILKNKGYNFECNLVGPIYCDKTILQNQIDDKGLAKFVNLNGPINSRDLLRDAYNSADVFLFPSHYEGFPMALLEAISCGLPCVATNVGGIPDILDNGFCGSVVEREGVTDIAGAIEVLLQNDVIRKQMSTNARVRATTHYTIEKSIDSYKKLLNL